jgi:two-component system cell cycle response regulator
MTARILVVDDIEANRDLLETRLTAEYFNVITAGDGQEALKICAETSVDLVLLDIMMPGIDGFEVCEQLKANAATCHIPVVIVTALDEMADRVRGLQAGADDFLTKPVDEMQLLARVRSLLRLKMLTDELRLRAVTARDIGLDTLLESHRTPKRARTRWCCWSTSARPILHTDVEGVGRVRNHASDDPQAGLFEAAEKGDDDCVIVARRRSRNYDALRIVRSCARLTGPASSRSSWSRTGRRMIW